MRSARLKQRLAGWLLVCASGMVACGSRPPAPILPTLTPVTRAATATPLPSSPTPTPEPLAALVNGEPITLAAYDQEIKRCRTGKQNAGLDPADCPAMVLQSQIENLAVEQAARAAGIVISDRDLEAELKRLQANLGGVEAYQAWLAANLYSDDEFRTALRRDLLRARMGAQVTASVGEAAEQVHARELLVADEATAQDLLAQIKAGADFAQLAAAYSLDLSSRPAGGDLGWFPHGLLTTPELEQAAFALQPGETSEVIHSALGYHIIQTLERDPARPLSLAAGQALREKAWHAWLEGVIAEAVVQTFVRE